MKSKSSDRKVDFGSTRFVRLTVLIMLATALGGCAVTASYSHDIREALLNSARKSEPNFPDGHELLLTHFSYFGHLVTSRGNIIYVVDQRGVITGMKAPRGQNFIVFFDRQFHYLGKISYIQSRPLWCDGSRLYLWGNLDGFQQPGQPIPPGGNVIDVAGGYGKITSYHAHVYGSSGGLDD